MDRRQKKCPSCGLVNFRDASQCQWCALALQDRVRAELVDDRPAASGPWGALLIMFAVAVLCGGVVWHLTRKAVAHAGRLATESPETTAPAKPAKRRGPPALSGRSPSDPAFAGDRPDADYLPMLGREAEAARQFRGEDYFRSREERMEKMREQERERERERAEWARSMQQPARPADSNER